MLHCLISRGSIEETCTFSSSSHEQTQSNCLPTEFDLIKIFATDFDLIGIFAVDFDLMDLIEADID